jgi:hypothetical protein
VYACTFTSCLYFDNSRILSNPHIGVMYNSSNGGNLELIDALFLLVILSLLKISSSMNISSSSKFYTDNCSSSIGASTDSICFCKAFINSIASPKPCTNLMSPNGCLLDQTRS